MSLSLARELINYQNDGFKTQLVGLFEKLSQYPTRAAAQSSKELERICEVILERTGVRITLLVDTNLAPQVAPVFLTNCHVLKYVPSMTNPQSDTALQTILSKKSFFKGEVDFKKAKVSGDYSRIEAPIWFNFDLIKDLKPGISAAILMHEVGHVWTCFALSWRTYRASQFLAAIHNAKTGRGTDKTYTHIVTEAAKEMEKEGLIASPKELETLVEVKDLNAQVSITYAMVLRKIQSDFGSVAASNHHTESLADTFATRYGFGVELAEGLGYYNRTEEGMLAYFSGTIFVAGIAGWLGLATMSVLTGGVAAAVMLALCVAIGGHSKLGVLPDELYGNEFDRLNRMRLNVIDILKDPKLAAGTRNDLLQQVDSLNKLVSNARVSRGLLTDLSNLVFSDRRETKAALDLETRLEQLAANDLFVGANKLKALS